MHGLFDLSGKTALVTGGARGLGKAMAVALAGAGADVAVSDVIEAREAVADIRAAGGGSHNIQVNAICPGLFETAMTAEFLEESAFMDYIRRRVPLARAGLPHELGGTAVYLASKASDYMTGHALVIDGGWTACL